MSDVSERQSELAEIARAVIDANLYDPGGSVGMETIEVIRTDAATHIRLRVAGS
jgi:hypothetical protein